MYKGRLMLEINTLAPDFTLPDENGNDVTLSSLRGKKVVLYFYPKDNTSGCTKEACSLRDNKVNFDGLNATILGVSKDSAKSHRSFIEKQNLNFTLLTDENAKVLEMYQAWGEKSMYGKKYMGIIRCTYIIDENGVIIKTYPKVSVATHGDDVKAYLESI